MHKVDMEALDESLGNITAIETFDKWQRLEVELRAIEFWNANYDADPNRRIDDICAFNARQVRKQTILQEMGKKGHS